MNIRRLLANSLLIALSSLGATASAQNATVPIPQTLEEADAQRARATQMRDEAEARFVVEQQACYAKFLVNSCIDDAKKRRTAALIEARQFDIPAREFQREAKRADVDAKEQQRADDAPRRAAQEQAQAEKFRADEAVRAAEREKKIADKARQAAEGRQNTAAEQARRQAKQAEIAKRDAELAAKRAPDTAKPSSGDAAPR